jgi:hypothetical protein
MPYLRPPDGDSVYECIALERPEAIIERRRSRRAEQNPNTTEDTASDYYRKETEIMKRWAAVLDENPEYIPSVVPGLLSDLEELDAEFNTTPNVTSSSL